MANFASTDMNECNDGNWNIGGSKDSSNFHGYIDDFAVYSIAFTEDEILTIKDNLDYIDLGSNYLSIYLSFDSPTNYQNTYLYNTENPPQS